MSAWVLTIWLCRDCGPPIRIYSDVDCRSAGRLWMVEARKWAERSRLSPIEAPFYGCIRALPPRGKAL